MDSGTRIPIINLKDEESALAIRLKAACLDFGFFYISGHDISQKLLDEVLHQTRRLFDLPLGEKMALQDKELTRGYTPMEEEKLDPQNQIDRGDTKEGFYIGREVPKHDKCYNPLMLSGPNVWPSPALTPTWDEKLCLLWRETMDVYFHAMTKLGIQVVQLLSLSLDLPKNFFDDAFSAPMAALRLLHYSSEPSAPAEGVFACGAHSDYGMITVLLTDHNRGLQIFTKEQEWIDVPPKKGHFIVNLGDMLERWTNGLFRSTRHRVVIPPFSQSTPEYEARVLKHSERYSIPFFFEPNFDTVVKCLEVCLNDPDSGERIPAKHPPITSGQYLLSKYATTHADFIPKK